MIFMLQTGVASLPTNRNVGYQMEFPNFGDDFYFKAMNKDEL